MKTKRVLLLVAPLLLMLTAVNLGAQETIRVYGVLGGGVADASGDSLRIQATLGQTFSGSYALDSGEVNLGFWQNFGGGTCCLVRGDVNNSGEINISDMTFIVNFFFRGGNDPACFTSADLDNSGTVNISDATYLINFLFRAGPLPVPC